MNPQYVVMSFQNATICGIIIKANYLKVKVKGSSLSYGVLQY